MPQRNRLRRAQHVGHGEGPSVQTAHAAGGKHHRLGPNDLQLVLLRVIERGTRHALLAVLGAAADEVQQLAVGEERHARRGKGRAHGSAVGLAPQAVPAPVLVVKAGDEVPLACVACLLELAAQGLEPCHGRSRPRGKDACQRGVRHAAPDLADGVRKVVHVILAVGGYEP